VTAWRTIGFDVDGVDSTSTALSANPPAVTQCKPVQTGLSLLVDGEEGRDNVAGSQVFATINFFTGGSLENKLAADMKAGTAPVLLFRMTDVNKGPDDTNVLLQVFSSAVTSPAIPNNWDGNDEFQVSPVSIKENALTNPKVAFLKGYMAGNTYVSSAFNEVGPAIFFLPLGPGLLELKFISSTLVIELDETHKIPIKATFSGVILPQDLQDPMRTLIDNYYCDFKSVLDKEIDKIVTFPDLYASGKDFHDATGTETCDAISAAFEFDLVPIKPIETINPNPQNPPFPCP
jgi:hypothetical protein